LNINEKTAKEGGFLGGLEVIAAEDSEMQLSICINKMAAP
jgi:hypothetical protein